MPPEVLASRRCGTPARRSAERGSRGHARAELPDHGAGQVIARRKGPEPMKVGVPKELKNHEYRVAMTPAGAHELVRAGHEVFVEQDAGAGSRIPDADFAAAGAAILPDADEVWAAGDLILKGKEPVTEEFHRLRKGQVRVTDLPIPAS